MRLRSINALKENDCLAKAIYNENGQVLLNKGVALTKGIIKKMKDKGITFVYIEDSLTGDLHITEGISEKTRRESINTIQSNFRTISEKMVLGKSIDMDKLEPSFSSVVKNILNDIRENKEAISMLSDVFCYDTYIFRHSLNVTVYSLALGKKYGLSEKQLEELGMGAILHDIGKIAIPENILNKKEALTDEEFKLIQEHPEIGFEMLRKSNTISLLAAHCAYQHHERIDGSGYPRGLKGKDILLYARLIGVADVFDAVTGNRVYRNAKLPHEALELLYAGVNTLFDKDIVEAFAKAVAIYPVGLEVTLSDGRAGIVAKQNSDFTSRPVIRVTKEKGETVVPYDVDLMKTLNVTISSCETSLTQEAAS